MSATTPLVSVAIPTYNRDSVLVQTIKDVQAQTVTNIEIIIADQTLQHDSYTEDFLTSHGDRRIRHYRLSPASSPAARNFCIKSAKAPIIIFLDDDVRLANDFVAKHLKVYKKYPNVSAVAGRVKQKGLPVTSTLTNFDKYCNQLGSFNCPDSKFTNNFPGGNFSAKKEALVAVGEFDTSYLVNAFREESDYSMRMIQLGHRIFYSAEAYIIHLAAPSGGNRLRKHQFNDCNFYINDLLFTIKYVRKINLLAAILCKYRKYVLTTYKQHRKLRLPLVFAARNYYFFSGLLIAVKRKHFPVKIQLREVR